MGMNKKSIDRHLELMKATESVANSEIEQTEARIIMKNSYEVSGMKRMAKAFQDRLNKDKDTPLDGSLGEDYWRGVNAATRNFKEWMNDFIEGKEMNIIDQN